MAKPVTSAKSEARLKPVEDPQVREAIMQAISDYNLVDSDAWSELDELSSHTEFEALEPNPDGIFETPGGFEAVANVYVILNYGPKNDSAAMTDSFPVYLKGTVDPSKVVAIEEVRVDNSSFYR
jgi:hypothetical protein